MNKEEIKQVSKENVSNDRILLIIFQLFNKFDNGNGRLSLAEIDRAIIEYYPQFGKNKRVIMRAYKAADKNGV